MNPYLYACVATITISLLSFIGLFSLVMGKQNIYHYVSYFVAFAAGVLLGNAFLHLLPIAYSQENALLVSHFLLSTILFLFFLEKGVHWHTHFRSEKERYFAHGLTNIISDSAHNIIDGIIIAGSFLISTPLGITSTITIAFHEIPQEFSDFIILIHAGFSITKALAYNALSALFAVLGVVIVYIAEPFFENIRSLLVPFTAGAFIYLACVQLLPMLIKEEHRKTSMLQLLLLCCGIALMHGLTYLAI